MTEIRTASGTEDLGYLRDAWYMACWDMDLTDAPVGITILGQAIALYRTADGNAVGLEDRCSHRMAPLSLGRCEGARLRCMYHGLLFNPDGTCAEVPGQKTVPPATTIRAYPVIEKYNAIWVWLGVPERADPAILPDFKGYGSSDWAIIPGHMDYDAPAKLIHDNLLDLSHVGFVHANSFAGSSPETAEAWIRGVSDTQVVGRGVRVIRWMPDSPAVRAGGAEEGRKSENSDSFALSEFIAPGIFLQITGRYPLGTAERVGNGMPDVEPQFSSFTCQAVTPLTSSTSRYFFAYGPDRRFERLKQSFHDLALLAFNEDKVMIEAQYAVLKSHPDKRMLPLAMDVAVMKYEGLLKKLRRSASEI